METNITINAIELASNLAHEKLMQYYEDLQDNRGFEFPNGIITDCDNGDTIYTEEGQDAFNEFYDEFLTTIEECKVIMKPTEIRDSHQKLREILQSYGNTEWGDCIIDEICFTFNYPTTTDVEVDFEYVQEWFYQHDTQWQNSMEEDFYNSDNKEGAKSYIDWAYMQYNEGIFINY